MTGNQASLAQPGLPAPQATSAVSISPILGKGDIITGVRGTTDGNVILTGSHATGIKKNTLPFLYQGPLTSAAKGVSALTPPFPDFQTGTFYGPDTNTYNPDTIPAGRVRAVGSYRTSPDNGVLNHGMVYLGPVNGSDGQWTTIDVPPDGSNTVGHVRACPITRPGCFVMDTIAHSTMGHLVVGNYDLKPAVGGGVVSGNAFIYNISTRRYTLLRLHGSLSTKSSFYGIWQDGGPGSPWYTLAGGSSVRGGQRGLLIRYNERTGRFGRPFLFTYANRPVPTHFDGITAAPGGFNLVAVTLGHGPAMAHVRALRHGGFGRARWRPVRVSFSALCPCQVVTGNTVWRNRVMGLYVNSASPAERTYLAVIAGR